ncbi:unnamed protein product [Rotaria socialis]
MPTSTQACTTFVPQFYVPVQNYANYRPPASSVRNITADFNQVTDVDEIHGVNEVNEVSPSSDTYKNTTSRRVLMAVLAIQLQQQPHQQHRHPPHRLQQQLQQAPRAPQLLQQQQQRQPPQQLLRLQLPKTYRVPSGHLITMHWSCTTLVSTELSLVVQRGGDSGGTSCSPGYGGAFTGALDEFYLYNRELTAAQIYALANP